MLVAIRHAPEIEEKLNNLFEVKQASIDLNTAHGNFRRGIFMQISLEVQKNYKKQDFKKIFDKRI